jgi:hypothetical protein
LDIGSGCGGGGQPKRKSGSSPLDFGGRPFHIRMSLMEAEVEEETVHLPGERLLDGG